MSRTLALIVRALAALACAMAPHFAAAAEFSVSPIRLEFEPGARSAAVTVTNDDTRPLRMQLRLMEWTQDASGADVYRDSDELVYFPRLMSVPPGEKRLVRVGLKSPAGAIERTYRLYLDELPDHDSPAARPVASGLSFTIRFALPIFLPAAASSRASGAIEALSLRDGKLRVAVRNTGTRHFRITALGVRSSGAFSTEAAGWYLLAGASRVHTIEIPAESCRSLRRIDVTVKAGELSLEGGLDVEPGMCAP
jgi:fimbrial chaperone protein